MSTFWQIRFAGSESILEVESAQRVLEGIREAEWEPSDDIRVAGERDWVAIEDHPVFADAMAELQPERVEPPDESRLDMNPLIDVSLVLLIFFILTTTYSAIRRTIEVPSEPLDKQGAAAEKKPPREEDIIDQVFRVEAWMIDDRVRLRVQDKLVELEDLEREMKSVAASSGKRELLLEIDGRVPWGIEAAIHDAAKGAEVKQIHRKARKPGAG